MSKLKIVEMHALDWVSWRPMGVNFFWGQLMHINCDAAAPCDPDPPCPVAVGETAKKPVQKDAGE